MSDSPAIQEDIVLEARTLFLRGGRLRDIVKLLQNRLALTTNERILVYLYLSKCFNLSLEVIVKIGNWNGFADGVDSDDYLEEVLRPAIQATEQSWIHDLGHAGH
jgi:hypothetical protein